MRTCAQQLVVEAKRRGVAVVLVGHVTKDGSLAGPRQLEHAVDTVLSFEGERHHALRLLRAVKHRFGPTSELGLFEMTDGGLVGVPDPSHLFLADRRRGVAGSVIVPAMEGQRPLLVEVQALTVPVPQGAPGRRNANGLDGGRLAMLLAVIERRAGLPVASNDVYVSTVGRRQARRARRRPRRGDGRDRRRPRRARSPATSSCSASSASAARCARSPRRLGASPRRRGSATAGRSSRRGRPAIDGIRNARRSTRWPTP